MKDRLHLRRPRRLLVLVSVFAFTSAAPLELQAQYSSPTVGQLRDCSSREKPAQIRDVHVVARPGQSVREPSKDSAGRPYVQLRDTIAIRVSNLDSLRSELECRRERDGREREIALFMDARPLVDVIAYPPSNPGQDVLYFPLRRTENSREVWTYLLGKSGLRPRVTQLSIGIADGSAVEPGFAVAFRVLPRGWLIFWVALFLGLLIGFFVLASRTGVLRDTGQAAQAGVGRVFSLARTQAAWWFFLILFAYLFIGLVTGDYSTSITGTVLTLLGISAGTTVGSAFIDANKSNPGQRELENAAITQLDKEVKQLDTDIQAAKAALATNPANSPAAMTTAKTLAERTAQKVAKTSQLKGLRNESEGFIRDILSDANGVNFHRFQIAAWTVVLGIIFVVEVYRELAMPQFSDTLLALMGISSGTYIGLKIPEATLPNN